MSRKVLTLRLNRLVSEEIVVKRAYAQRPERFDYILTGKGWELCDILLAISAWGDKWTMADAGPPALIRNRSATTSPRPKSAALTAVSRCTPPTSRSPRCGDHQAKPRGVEATGGGSAPGGSAPGGSAPGPRSAVSQRSGRR